MPASVGQKVVSMKEDQCLELRTRVTSDNLHLLPLRDTSHLQGGPRIQLYVGGP